MPYQNDNHIDHNFDFQVDLPDIMTYHIDRYNFLCYDES